MEYNRATFSEGGAVNSMESQEHGNSVTRQREHMKSLRSLKLQLSYQYEFIFLCLSFNFFVPVTFRYAQLKIQWKDARKRQV